MRRQTQTGDGHYLRGTQEVHVPRYAAAHTSHSCRCSWDAIKPSPPDAELLCCPPTYRAWCAPADSGTTRASLPVVRRPVLHDSPVTSDRRRAAQFQRPSPIACTIHLPKVHHRCNSALAPMWVARGMGATPSAKQAFNELN